MDSLFSQFRVLREHSVEPPPELFQQISNRVFHSAVEERGRLARIQEHDVPPPDFISPRIAASVRVRRSVRRPLTKSLLVLLKKIFAFPIPR